MLHPILLLFLSNVYMVWTQTTVDVSPSSYSNVSYCGKCWLEAEPGVIFLIPLPSTFVPVVTTISVITNANGTTTSTSINGTASSLIYSEVSYLGYRVDIVTAIPQEVRIEAELEILAYGTLSIANGSTSCVPLSKVINSETNIVFPQSSGVPVTDIGALLTNWPVSSVITDILTGQPIPQSCSAEFPGEPVWQIPAQFLTTTISVNNVPASNPSPTTTPAPEPISQSSLTTSSLPPSLSVVIAPSPTLNTQPRSTIPSATTSVELIIQQPTTTPSITSVAKAPIPALQRSSALSSILQSGIVIGGQTLSPGSTITISGTTFSLAASAAATVVGGQTLSPGSAITFSGATFSLDTSASAIVVGGSTISLNSDATGSTCASGSGLGFEIISVFNGGCPTQAIASSSQGIVTMGIQTGAGMRRGISLWVLSAMGAVVMVLLE